MVINSFMYVPNPFKQLHKYSKWPSKMLGRRVSSSFQPTGMQDLMLGGKSVHTGVNVVFVLPLMAFPFLFLNLIENGISPISSHDCGSNLNSSFESF